MEIHRLLKRQLKKSGIDVQNLPTDINDLLGLVSNSYYSFDEERKLNQRAVEISNNELKEINQQLEEQNAFLNSFNYGLAHDAKNHTANLKGLIKMFFKYRNTDPGMVTKIGQKLELSVNQMSAIIDGFLFLSTIEGSSDELKKNINPDLLEEMIRVEIDYLLDDKKPNLIFNFEFEQLTFSYHVLRVILVNLISNSLKFSQKNIKAEIIATVRKEGDKLKITVKDNGIGMDLEDPDSTMFKLFDKRNKNTKVKGYGIGLFMIKRILDTKNGTISVKSALHQGTEVKIDLPININ